MAANAGAQALPSAGGRGAAEQSRNPGRAEEVRGRAAAAGAGGQPAGSHCIAGLHCQRLALPVAGIGHDATSNAGLMISQELPFPGKQKLRAKSPPKRSDAEFQRYLAVRLNVVARLKRAYHELHHAAVGKGFDQALPGALLRNILRVSESRYSVGRAAQQDIFKAQTQFSIFETQMLRYEQERASKEIEINALLNRPGGGHIEVPEDLPPGEMPATLDEMLAHARAHAPSLAREQKSVERNELAAGLARRD